MNEVDDILGEKNNPNKNKYSVNRPYNAKKQQNNNWQSKNNWRDEQNKLRHDIYMTMDKKAIEVSRNGNMFKHITIS